MRLDRGFESCSDALCKAVGRCERLSQIVDALLRAESVELFLVEKSEASRRVHHAQSVRGSSYKSTCREVPTIWRLTCRGFPTGCLNLVQRVSVAREDESSTPAAA